MRTTGGIAAALLVCVLAACGSSAPVASTSTTTVPPKPGWTGYVTADVRDHLTNAVWNGEEMVLVAFDDTGDGFSNEVRAFDPAVGSWRTLPPLPTDIPVTINGVAAGRQGVVAEGLGCDPARSSDAGDGLRCEPGDLRTFLLRPGDDAFVRIDAPPRAAGEAGPAFFVGGSDAGSDLMLIVDGATYRLADDDSWDLVEGLGAGAACVVGDRILGNRPDAGEASGARLAWFDPRAGTWTPINTSGWPSDGSLHCGDGEAAWYLPGGLTAETSSSYLLTPDRPPLAIELPTDSIIGTVTTAGGTFFADITRFVPGGDPADAEHRLHLVDPTAAALVPSDIPAGLGSTEIYDLDGRNVLAVTQPTDPSNPAQIEVLPLPNPAR